MGGSGEEVKQTDHDLLLTIATRFTDFKDVVNDSIVGVGYKLDAVLRELHTKADKSDVKELRDEITNVRDRVILLEGKNREKDIEKTTIKKIAELGIRGWTFIIGAGISLITLIKLLSG